MTRNGWDFSTWNLGALVNRAFPVGLGHIDSGPVWIDLRGCGRGSGNQRPALAHSTPRLEGVFTFQMPSGTLTVERDNVSTHDRVTEISEEIGRLKGDS